MTVILPHVRYLAASCALAEEARKVRETSPNWSKDIRLYGLNCEPPITFPIPWCAAFVQYITDKACRAWGVRNPLDDVKREAYVPDYAKLAADKGWVIPPTMVDVGDLVLFRFPGGPSRWNHIGIVTRPPDEWGQFTTVEGNTGDPSKDQRDGDGVYIKARSIRHNYQTMFVRWDRNAHSNPNLRPLKAAA